MPSYPVGPTDRISTEVSMVVKGRLYHHVAEVIDATPVIESRRWWILGITR